MLAARLEAGPGGCPPGFFIILIDMGKLVTIICESMTWFDLQPEDVLPGFTRHKFDFTPASDSAQSFWCMQTDKPIPSSRLSWRNEFENPDIPFLSRHVPTRIIAHFWPRRFNARVFDDESKLSNDPHDNVCEPDSTQWFDGLQTARTWSTNQKSWLIYWGRMGHLGLRKEEGIPTSLNMTLKEWFKLLNEQFIPLVDQSIPMLVHSDHGTARKGHGNREFHEGFLFSRGVDLPPECAWSDVREAQSRCLGV